jgi:serine/threonine protein kinase
MEELIGTKLQDRYQIETLLSHQTGRRTFLAIDLSTHQSVTIKLLLFTADFTWEDLKLFEREAEVLKSLDCPAIPQYLDFFEVELEHGKGFALVQTYIEAKSLQQWVHGGRTFSEAELKAISIDLLKILDYLHTRNPAVIHRDIKPSNILLTDRAAHSAGEVYLIDFGSVQTAIKGGTRTIVGTYGYMPPEQFGGIATPASDIYALGATLIYLATGLHPDELPQQEFRIKFEDRVNLRPRFVHWIQQAIAPHVEKRFSSAQQALLSLDGDISLNNDGSDPIVKKPVGSKVQVKITRDRIEILQPCFGFNIVAFLTTIVTIWIVSTLIENSKQCHKMYLASPLTRAEGLYMVFILIILAFSIVALLVAAIFMINRSSKLEIDRSRVSISNRYFDLYTRTKNSGITDNINRLEISPTNPSSYLSLSKEKNLLSRHLIIWLGIKPIHFGSGLTLPELEWIGEFLSDWLDVPLSKV